MMENLINLTEITHVLKINICGLSVNCAKIFQLFIESTDLPMRFDWECGIKCCKIEASGFLVTFFYGPTSLPIVVQHSVPLAVLPLHCNIWRWLGFAIFMRMSVKTVLNPSSTNSLIYSFIFKQCLLKTF